LIGTKFRKQVEAENYFKQRRCQLYAYQGKAEPGRDDSSDSQVYSKRKEKNITDDIIKREDVSYPWQAGLPKHSHREDVKKEEQE